MSKASLTGSDTVVINDRNFADFADGDCVTLDFEGDIADAKTGKNGNTIYSINETGRLCTMTVRLLRGSVDDKYLNKLLEQQSANFAGFVLMFGEFVKRVGDGAGNVLQDTYIVSGGIFTKRVNAKMNVEGDVEQSVSVYTMKFSNSPRALT